MLLRESAQNEATMPNLNAVTDDQSDAGVPNSQTLRQLSESLIKGEWDTLALEREKATATLGLQQTTDVLTVASAFNGITRVADSTGIPLDDTTAAATDEMRKNTGIEQFEYQQKSSRYDSSR